MYIASFDYNHCEVELFIIYRWGKGSLSSLMNLQEVTWIEWSLHQSLSALTSGSSQFRLSFVRVFPHIHSHGAPLSTCNSISLCSSLDAKNLFCQSIYRPWSPAPQAVFNFVPHNMAFLHPNSLLCTLWKKDDMRKCSHVLRGCGFMLFILEFTMIF
jgi:hypothetical protein